MSQKEPSYYWIENAVASHFNRLKGKLFNLIEASITDKEQCKAIKGLVKDFANSEYGLCIENMRYEAKQAKFIDEKSDSTIPPLPAYPLEGGKKIWED